MAWPGPSALTVLLALLGGCIPAGFLTRNGLTATADVSIEPKPL